MTEKRYLDQYDSGDPNFRVDDHGIHESQLNDEQEIEVKHLIGEIVFSFNELESDLDRIIAEIINQRSHNPGYTITAEVGSVFTKKVLIFKSLYGQMAEAFSNDEFKQEFNDLVTLLFSLKDIRNEVVHANWSGASDKYEVRLRHNTDERGPYALVKAMPPDYLISTIERIDSAIERLAIFDEHRDQLLVHGKILKPEDFTAQT
jgi:hypothetical protein